jgi:phage gpG-like protein
MATTITIEQWRDQLARMVRSGAIRKGLDVAAGTLAAVGQGRAVRHATDLPGRPRGLGRVSRALTGSLAGEVETRAHSVDVVLSSGGKSGFGAVPYARIHEMGGTIRAKGGGWLRFKGNKGWATVKSVDIPARPYLQPALDYIAKRADRVISDEIARVLEGRT